MKHPDLSIEACEFNLGRAPVLRCSSSSDEVPYCGECDSCHLGHHLSSAHSWFSRAGHQSRRRFLLGLIRRLHSVDLLQHVIYLLKPVLRKDFVYARTRVAPSLDGDRATNSGDRALNEVGLEKSLANVWIWFEAASYWTKTNFLMGVLQKCEPHELHVVGIHAKTLLVPQQRSFAPTDDYEAESIHSSSHSFHTEDNPDLEMVSMRPGYSHITDDPFPQPTSPSTRSKPQEYIEDDCDDDASFLWGTDDDALDPTCMVIPVSTKAYAGVARYVDFISGLPVHISKYVLSFMDMVSLSNCVCVSQHWRALAEEVHKDFTVSQRLCEEVMLMQGTAAQACNPNYAKDVDVAVPNIRLHTWETIRTSDATSKSETSMINAYVGCSTRNIIMEERNVYCGPYNVLILNDVHDPGRVLHTDGSHLIAMGSTDRKVRFLNCETTCGDEKPIAGHSGSIKCIALDSKRNFVLSGSFDTSIRKWSLETGKCLKIFHGHRDTVNCIQIRDTMAVSGSKDHTCKVWNIETMECIRMFKHKESVTAVRLSDDICITGCSAGKVKVWEMASGKLIKRLTGHQAGVTGIRFDRWHIITTGRDGYALVWSSQGDHARCLNTLRHPKEVLCVEFMYLRVVTGAGDGKIRIWNMVTGQCLRIMRGNSRSDPITDMVAIDNRITINTVKNVIVFNFEPITYDYTLEDDKMPPLVQYMSYTDTPVRPQPYSYIRAQRMLKAGATNTKIVHHDESKMHSNAPFGEYNQPDQIPHSAKTLSSKSMQMAKRIQSADGRLEADRTPSRRMMRKAAKTALTRNTQSAGVHMTESKQEQRLKVKENRNSSRSLSPHSVASSTSFNVKMHDNPDDQYEVKRRVSWAFDDPNVPPSKDVGLAETKSLFRSQMRIPEEAKTPPDFVYLKVNAIQNTLKQPAGVTRAIEAKRKEEELYRWRSGRRPSSSPSRIDARTKVMVRDMSSEDLGMLHLIPEQPEVDEMLEANDSLRLKNSSRARGVPPSSVMHTPQPMAIITEYGTEKIDAKPNVSLHSSQVKSHIPGPKLLRPHTASVVHNKLQDGKVKLPQRRPLTALSSMQVETAPISVKRPLKEKVYSSSAMETSHVPMLMYPSDMQQRLKKVKERKLKDEPTLTEWTPGPSRVSLHNHPLRSHVEFKLKTFQQEEDELREIEHAHQAALKERDQQANDSQRKLWLAKVRGEMKNHKMKVKRK